MCCYALLNSVLCMFRLFVTHIIVDTVLEL